MARNKSEKETRAGCPSVGGDVTIRGGSTYGTKGVGGFILPATPKSELILALQRMSRKVRKAKEKQRYGTKQK